MTPESAARPNERLETGAWSDPSRNLTGRTLADFRVERLLGHGGMGEVYLARQVSLDRSVALKVLKPDLAGNPTYMARFESEAWAAAKLNHPNIVQIYTLGGVDGLKFIAMEYVPGTNLREFLARRGVPELPLALSIMKQSGQAVGAAGEAGLVHRDIKPENLLLTRKGQVKVADFGLCRVHDSKINLTQEGVTLGTPLYMSPEQVQGKPTDHRSDLYSLGVTFYHMLSGAPPFIAETPVALALKHVNEKPVSLAVHRPDLPPELVGLVMRLLEKDAAKRYQSAGEMLRDLSRIKEAITASAQTATSQPVLTAADASALTASPAAVTKPKRAVSMSWWRRTLAVPRLGRKVLATVLGAALLSGVALGWMARSEDLLGRGAPLPESMPGIWMEHWESTVPDMKTPLAQYRYAQTRAEASNRQAAWLAVPGRFPNTTDVVFRAYVQLVRELLRRGDAERLSELAGEFDEASGRLKRDDFQMLSRTARAGAAALRNDASAVLEQFRQWNLTLIDPALAEVGVEIVLIAAWSPSASGSTKTTLRTLYEGLLEPLQLSAWARLGANLFPPG